MRVNGVQLRVRGKVQGVGFRPFFWQLAHQMMLTGDVCNDGEGVLVRLAGNGGDFTARLRQDCPPLARIDAIDTQPFTWRRVPEKFTIRELRTEYKKAAVLGDVMYPKIGKTAEGYVVSLQDAAGNVFANIWLAEKREDE